MREITGRTYMLPHLLAGQYVLTSIRGETPDGIMYEATQKDTQREVLVHSLHAEMALDTTLCHTFIEDARACTRVQLPFVSAVLELLPADDTWHLVCEGNGTDSLDFAAAAKQSIRCADMVDLLNKIGLLCLHLDALGINSRPFRLAGVYRQGQRFLLDNPACSGRRLPHESNRSVIDAVKALLPLLEAGEASAVVELRHIMQRVADKTESCALVAAELLCELARIPAAQIEEELLLG